MEIYPLFQWPGHRDAVYTLAAGANGQAVSAGGDGIVVAWNTSQPHNPGKAMFRLNSGIYILLPPSSHHAGWLAGGRNGELHSIFSDSYSHLPYSSTEIGDIHGSISAPGWPTPVSNGVATGKTPIHDLQFMGNWLWSAHGDGRLLRWNLEDRFPSIDAAFALAPSALRCLSTHPSAPHLASGSSDGKIRLTGEKGEILQEFVGHTLSVFSLLFLVGGKYLLSGSRDAHLAVWETESGKLLGRFPAHMGTLNHLVAIPECGWVGSAGRDKEIRLWDAHSLELRRVINREHFPQHAHTHSVNRLLWMPGQRHLLSAGDDRKIRVWQFSQPDLAN